MRKLVIRLLFYLAFLLFLRWRISAMFYVPDRVRYGQPSDAGLPFEEVTFAGRDGTRLSGWFIPAVGPAKGTVVHFHGNAQNMTAHFGFVAWLPRAGYNLFVFDYRGYGRSEGRPGRKGVYEDSIAALDYVLARPDVVRGRVVALGQSLGGANAIAVLGTARKGAVRALAVDSAFYSYRLMVRDKIRAMPILGVLAGPLAWLLADERYSPAPAVPRLAPMPLLVFHGTADPVVDYTHAGRIYQAAGEPRELVTLPGGFHTDAFIVPGDQYKQKLLAFFQHALELPLD